VLERFFDEAGGMQLVLHAPFGSRVNRAWGLALRKRFCRSFNFELQAAATEDAIVLSLGPQHSFPLEDVFQYLKPETAEHLLCRRCSTRRCSVRAGAGNATRALAVLRARGGKKVPTPLQRMDAEDLVAAVSPTSSHARKNLVGDRGDSRTTRWCSRPSRTVCSRRMDFPALKRVLEGMAAGQFTLVARDTTEPSPLAHEVINAKAVRLLDDAATRGAPHPGGDHATRARREDRGTSSQARSGGDRSGARRGLARRQFRRRASRTRCSSPVP